VLQVGILIFIALALEGCDPQRNALWRSKDIPRIDGYLGIVNLRVPQHFTPYWRTKRDYWKKTSFTDPDTKKPDFNSCMNPHVQGLETCSGKGSCLPWDPEDLSNPVFFCKCNPGFAGPECSHKRKSQAWAWFLSVAAGYTGADMFYLEWPYFGTWKAMFSIGAAVVWYANPKIGVPLFFSWWLWDIVKIGAGRIYSHDYRVAPDLPRWAFAVFSFLFMSILGYFASVIAIYHVVLDKRRKIDNAINMGAKIL